jgi:hypothetical protein
MNGSLERKLYAIGIAGYAFFPDRIQILPDSLSELTGEKAIEIPIPPHSREVLICIYSINCAKGGSKEIIFRDEKGEEHANSIPDFTALTHGGAQKLAQTITAETGLPVRLIMRRPDQGGRVQELEWEPFFTKRNRLPFTFMLISLPIPFLGGALVGCGHLSLSIVIYLGVLLWALQILGSLIVLSREKRKESYSPLVVLLVTTVRFVSTYSVMTMLGFAIPHFFI